MSLRAIVYASKAQPMLKPFDLDEILIEAMTRNQVEQVTGVLLYDGQAFLQYIEGAPDAIEWTYARICRSRRHCDIRVLWDAHVPERYFFKWSMACRNVDASIIHTLEAARWGRQYPHLASDMQAPDGIAWLVDFWADTPGHTAM